MARDHLLPIDTTPEDIEIGAFWTSIFESVESEVAKRGVLQGTPTVNKGLFLNGTTDYILYDLNKQFGSVETLGIQIVFCPAFEITGDFTATLIDTDAPQYRIFKTASGQNFALRIVLADINIIDISSAVYGPLWRVNERNVLTLSSVSGNTNVWLNGTQIATAVATAWTPTEPTLLSIGATDTGISTFWKSVHLVKFYNSLLTEQDHLNLWYAGGC
jgi:hypothetical protein